MSSTGVMSSMGVVEVSERGNGLAERLPPPMLQIHPIEFLKPDLPRYQF